MKAEEKKIRAAKIENMTPVNSSNIHSVGYNHDEKVLQVQFWKGKDPGRKYRYWPVAEEAYKELLSANSVGAYFSANIRSAQGITTIEL